MLWRLGQATQTDAPVLVHDTTGGTLTGECNGSAGTVTDFNDSDVGMVLFDGLEAGKRYPFTISIDGEVIISATLKTLPAAGHRATLAVGSCEKAKVLNQFAHWMAECDMVEYPDDHPYTNGNITQWGESIATDTDTDQSAAVHRQHYATNWANPYYQKVYHHTPCGSMKSDHLTCGNNWDHTLTNANLGGAALADQAEVDAVWHTANSAWNDFYPDGTLLPLSGAKPEAAAAGTSADNYVPTPRYYTLGYADIFVPDLITSRDEIATNGNLMSSEQEFYLLAWLAASTNTYKVIVSSKFSHSFTGSNSDGWESAEPQLGRIMNYIKDNDITGVFMLSGDDHVPCFASLSIANGDSHDWLCVNGCPMGSDVKTSVSSNSTVQIIRDGNWTPEPRCATRVTFEEDKATIEVIDWSGAVIWMGYVYAGTNVLAYPDRAVSA